MEVAKDAVFPSRVLKRQLDDAQQRLRVMESELEEIRLKEEERQLEDKRVWHGLVPAFALFS